MAKYDNDKDKVVTIFNRKKLRPAIDDAARPTSGSVPELIYFVLPDGSEYPVDTTLDIVIGRQPRPDDPVVTIDLEPFDGHDLGVSRYHAMIKLVKDNLILVDVASSNGTFVNGHRALPTNRYKLVDGDTLTVGRLTLQIRFNRRNRR